MNYEQGFLDSYKARNLRTTTITHVKSCVVPQKNFRKASKKIDRFKDEDDVQDVYHNAEVDSQI